MKRLTFQNVYIHLLSQVEDAFTKLQPITDQNIAQNNANHISGNISRSQH